MTIYQDGLKGLALVVHTKCTLHGLAVKVTCLNNERTRGHFVTFARFARSVTFWLLLCSSQANGRKIHGQEIFK